MVTFHLRIINTLNLFLIRYYKIKLEDILIISVDYFDLKILRFSIKFSAKLFKNLSEPSIFEINSKNYYLPFLSEHSFFLLKIMLIYKTYLYNKYNNLHKRIITHNLCLKNP